MTTAPFGGPPLGVGPSGAGPFSGYGLRVSLSYFLSLLYRKVCYFLITIISKSQKKVDHDPAEAGPQPVLLIIVFQVRDVFSIRKSVSNGFPVADFNFYRDCRFNQFYHQGADGSLPSDYRRFSPEGSLGYAYFVADFSGWFSVPCFGL